MLVFQGMFHRVPQVHSIQPKVKTNKQTNKQIMKKLQDTACFSPQFVIGNHMISSAIWNK